MLFVPWWRAFGLAAGGILILLMDACTPLPAEPDVRGPKDDRTTTAATLRTRELVWASSRRTIKITLGSHLCRKGASGGDACVRLSRADGHELDRFFGTQAFHARWAAFNACPTQGALHEGEAFAVTYATGEKIGKALDMPVGSPMTGLCDRATRDAISAVGEELVARYFQ